MSTMAARGTAEAFHVLRVGSKIADAAVDDPATIFHQLVGRRRLPLLRRGSRRFRSFQHENEFPSGDGCAAKATLIVPPEQVDRVTGNLTLINCRQLPCRWRKG